MEANRKEEPQLGPVVLCLELLTMRGEAGDGEEESIVICSKLSCSRSRERWHW